jgi:exonuclease SbcD
MKLLHTADWHLGRYFKNYTLLDDQAQVLQQLIGIIREERPDAVLLAGDIYDRSLPPADAIALLDNVLAEIVLELGIPLIAIAGNHDSAERVAYCQGILQKKGLYMVGYPSLVPQSIKLQDAFGELYVYPIPYTEPEVLKQMLQAGDQVPEQLPKSHEEVMAYYVAQIKKIHPEGQRAVLMAHAFINEGEESDSERKLSVGGAAQVSAALFKDFHYTALGHLHRPQTFLEGRVHYSGSLLQYSTSEAGQAKSCTLVEIDGQGAVNLRKIFLKAPRKIERLRGTIEGQNLLLHPEDEGKAAAADFVEMRLYNEEPVLNAMAIVQKTFPNAIEIHWHYQNKQQHNIRLSTEELAVKSPEELFEDFYKRSENNQKELPARAKEILYEIIKEINTPTA